MIHIIQTLYRLFKYKAEWSKQIREIKIRKQQKSEIVKLDKKTKKLILFFIPGADYISGKENISGGLISIISLAQESAVLYKETNTKVVCVTYYNDHLLFKITTFQNSFTIFRTPIIENYFKELDEIIIQLPELFVADFVEQQLGNNWLNSIKNVHVNILNQSIQLMPDEMVLNKLKQSINLVTITTAHKKYCNVDFHKAYGVPLHLLSVWISPENYCRREFEDKENLILFSPDNNELTASLISYFQKFLPQYSCQIISGLTYEKYKYLISIAKFVFTTGEGLDAYFVETFFSGGVSFAIKNLNFFDGKYLDLPCLFDEHDDLAPHLFQLIKEFDKQQEYTSLNKRVFNLLSEDYSYGNYQNNLKRFYSREYTYA